MASGGLTESQNVEDVLRARANARRIKEHYEGTLGVPSELQSLGHLLAHDKDAVFAGLESLPFYNKSNLPAPPAEIVTAAGERSRRRQPSQTEPGAPSHTAAERHPQIASAEVPGQQEQAQLPIQTLWPLEPRDWGESPKAVALQAFGSPPHPQQWNAPGDVPESQGSPGTVSPTLDGSPRRPHPDPHPHQQHHPAWQERPSEGVEAEAGVGAALGSPGTSSPQASSSPTRREGFGSWGPLSAPGSVSLSGSVPESETEENMKHRLARQRLLSANDLSPQEWARIGPPQDAVDLDKFTAREYSVIVDYDRYTFAPKRVARPDIFHIAPEEAQRRQVEADEATLALQAARRAEAEAAERAAEEERLARAANRGPQYDSLGVLQPHPDRTVSPSRPRYLDWHPECVGGVVSRPGSALDPQAGHPGAPQTHGQSGQGRKFSTKSLLLSRRSAGGMSGGGEAAATAAGGSSVASRCASALKSRAESAAAHGHHSQALRGQSAQRGSSYRAAETSLNGETAAYVYEDFGEDLTDGDAMAYAAAYGTHPPQRRHHSALAGSGAAFSPPQRPAGVTEAHYAQMVRQQRRWLNGPALPPRPASAAPMPPPVPYVRPRSSRPPPEGTAAPMPSRLAAEAAALAAAAAALTRQHSALQTVIHERLLQPTGPPRPRTSWAAISHSSSRGESAWSSFRKHAGLAAGGEESRSDVAQQAAAGGAPARHKRLPWEAREHAAAALAASIIPSKITLEGEEPSGVMGSPRSAAASGRRFSTTGLGAGAGGGGGAGGRSSSVSGPRGRQASAVAKGRASGGRPSGARGQLMRNSTAVFGETLVPEGAGADAEGYAPRKFELYDGMVLDGYMGRLP